jgi:hypothetical protein
MAYIGQEPGLGEAERFVFTATAVTDTVTADDDGVTIGYTVGQVSVYLNGVKQVVGTDVTCSNGSTCVFASDYAIGDVIEVIALSTFSPADTVPATGGTFTGAVTASAGVVGNLTGNASGTAATVTTAAQPAIESVGTLNTLTVDNVIVDGTTIGHTSDTDLLTLTSGNLAVAGIVTAPSLVLTPGTAPATTEGAIYYNTTTKVVYVYNGSSWKNLSIPATGGKITSYTLSGTTYIAHTFTSSDTFTPASSGTVEYLVVAGGAGGGSGSGSGGGGAGGFRTATGLAVTAQSYTITVGAGGTKDVNGGNSVFSSITSTGGGTGGRESGHTPGTAGGSGGGGIGYTTAGAGGAASPSGQGYAGGTGGSAYFGGGGGGAGQVGTAGVGATSGGGGGNGLSSSISGTPTFYSGGGGGHTQTGDRQAPGGSGGGGDGGNYYYSAAHPGTTGVANTGGGGGGTHPSGMAGGSGIVIIRYAI